MKQLLDMKEELETERDTYKSKYNRLNTEVNFIMRGDEKHVVDIDAMIMENRFVWVFFFLNKVPYYKLSQ